MSAPFQAVERRARISVIVPVLNSMASLKPCLDAIVAAMESYREAELILVDNGSTDGSYETMVNDYGQLATVVRLPHVTISALRNHGARLATGEYLSFIDSDCLIRPDYFHRAMNVFADVNPEAAGCDYERPQPAPWVEETWHLLHWRPKDEYVNYLLTGNLLVRKSVFDKIGGFDESLVTGEDSEFGVRLNASGGRLYRSRDILAVHLGNPRTVRAFWRKQLWHSHGMFGSVNIDWLDRPLLMTFAHLALLFAGVAIFPWLPGPIVLRVLASAIALTMVPAMSVAYRFRQRGAVCRPLRCLFLYELFFGARVFALFQFMARRPAASGRERAELAG